MAGLLSDILGLIDRAKQSAKANVGLLVSNPQEYFMSMEDQAREHNRLGALAIQAKRNAARGLPVTQEQAAAKQYIDQKTYDLAMGFAGTTKVGKTPFELAHETAQRNATTMLGLPPNNTAMDRAKALGYTTEAYHATPQQFSEFKAGGIDPTLSGEAIWLSPYKDYYAAAHNIGGYKGNYVPGTNVMPLNVKIKSPMELDDQNMLDWARDVYAGGSKEFPQLISPQTAKDVKADYGSILFEGEKLGLGKNSNEMIVFDPKNIRSRFAAFDPARVNEADLLAAGIPLGLIANTQIDIPKPTKKKKAK